MSTELMRQTADVLEKLANWLDADDHQQAQQRRAERQTQARLLGEKFAAVTGEDLSPDAIEKLASSDQDLVAIFQKLAGAAPAGDAPEGMGAATDIADDGDKAPAHTNTRYQNSREKHAAAEDAEARFLDWINS